MYDWETLQKALQQATPEQLAALDEAKLVACVQNTIIRNQLNPDLHNKLMRILGLLTLQSLTTQDALVELKNLGVTDPEPTLTTMTICISGVKPQSTVPPAPTPTSVRTMANDMNAAQTKQATESVYTSTQEAILKEAVPKPTTDVPKWESDK